MVMLIGANLKDNVTVVGSDTILTTAEGNAAWTTGTNTNIPLYYGTPGVYIRPGEAEAQDRSDKRYVSVWVLDQDENVPLDKSILYEKVMFFADKTKDEIKADIPLTKLLDKHNDYRVTLKDKNDKPLKKVRLRDISVVIRNW